MPGTASETVGERLSLVSSLVLPVVAATIGVALTVAVLGALYAESWAYALLHLSPLLSAALAGYALWLVGIGDRGARRLFVAACAAQHRTALLKGMISASADPVLLVDGGGRIELGNLAARRLFGTSVDGAGERSFLRLIEDIAGASVARAARAMLAGDGPERFACTVRLAGDGVERQAEIVLTRVVLRRRPHPQERRQRHRAALLCTLHNPSAAGAGSAAIERRRFSPAGLLMQMSHELRTPLNAIIGFAEMMERQIFGSLGHARYGDYARHIRSSGRRLLDSVSEILDLSQIESGEFRLTETRVDPRDAVRSAAAQAAAELDVRPGAVAVEIDEGCGCLQGDRAAIVRIVRELLSVAIRFARPEQPPRIRVRMAKDGGIAIGISQPAPGPAVEELACALTLTAPGGGGGSVMGLGLSLAFALARLHDGTIAVGCGGDAGTTMTVAFPPQRTLAP